METPRKQSDSSNSGPCPSCAATRGSSITEWHVEDCVAAPEGPMSSSFRSREDCHPASILNQSNHASGEALRGSTPRQANAVGIGSPNNRPSSGLYAEPQRSGHLPVDYPTANTQTEDNQTGHQPAQDALEYSSPRLCGRRPHSAQLASFFRTVEREDPRSVVARAAEAFPDVPDNVSEPDQEDIHVWGRHYRWDYAQTSGVGTATAGEFCWEAVSPLSRSPSPGYSRNRDGL